MRLIFTNQRIAIVCDHAGETSQAKAFADSMSFAVEGAVFTEAFREGKWDGRERLITRERSPDPTPYLTHARAGAVRAPDGSESPPPTLTLPSPDEAATRATWAAPGHSLWSAPVGFGENVLDKWPKATVIDARRKISRRIRMRLRPSVIPNLRPYQAEAVREITGEYGVLTGKGLVRLPTRAGKTVIAGAATCAIGARSAFIVNSDMLLTQTVKFFEKAIEAEEPVPEGLPLIGQYGGGVRSFGWVTVLSVQTIITTLEDPERKVRAHKKRLIEKVGKLRRNKYDGTEEEARKKIDAAIRRARSYLLEVEYTLKNGRIEKGFKIKRDAKKIAELRDERAKLLAFLSQLGTVFFDECHHLVSDLWREAMELADAPNKIGLSATIHFEESGTPRASIWLMAATGPVFYTLTPSELIERGWLCRPRITFLNAPDPVELPPISDTFDAIYRWGIAQNGPRNDKITECVMSESGKGKRCLVTVRYVYHIEDKDHGLGRTFDEAGLRWAAVTGQTTASKREKIIAALKARELDVVVGTVFKEAVDLPFLDTVIIGDGGSSRILALQRLRNLTPVDENDRVIREPMVEAKTVDVYDFADFSHKFLREHSLARLDEYNSHPAFIVRYERD